MHPAPAARRKRPDDPWRSRPRRRHRQRPDLRHDPARRGAGAGRRADRRREARGGAPARPPQGRRHRGRLPGGVARRLRGCQSHRPRDEGCRDRRPGTLPGRRSAAGDRGDQGRGAATPPRLHRHERHPPDPQASAQPRPGARRRGPLGPPRPRAAGARRRDRVLRGRRLPHRPRLPPPGLRGRRRGRRVDSQHPGHRGLCHPGGVRSPRRPGRRAGRARRDGQHPLPQRPGARDREYARRGPGRRAAGRSDDQRPGGARRQRVARGGRNGPPDAPHTVPAARQPGTDRADHRGEPAGQLSHGLRDPAEQGDRRRQRLRPRIGHPPGRRDQEPAHLRDHDPAVGRSFRKPADDRQAVRAARPPAEAQGAGARGRGREARRALPPGDRPGRREEGGDRRRPPRHRRAARVGGPGFRLPSRLERDELARRQRHGDRLAHRRRH